MSLIEKTDIRDSDEKVVEIEMERLRNFTNHTIAVEIGWGSIERLLGLLWRETEGRTYNSRDEN